MGQENLIKIQCEYNVNLMFMCQCIFYVSTVWKFSEIVHFIGNIGLHQILHSTPVQRLNICKEQCDNGTKQDGSSRVKLIKLSTI